MLVLVLVLLPSTSNLIGLEICKDGRSDGTCLMRLLLGASACRPRWQNKEKRHVALGIRLNVVRVVLSIVTPSWFRFVGR